MSQSETCSLYKSSLVSKNITLNGRRTSVRLEPEMWQALREIAERERCTIHDLCGLIEMKKGKNSSLTAAIRVFLMLYFRAATTEDGHGRAGHGDFLHMCRRAGIAKPLGHWPHPQAVNQRRALEQRVLHVRYS